MIVDSHCHLDRLDLKAHGGDLSKALLAARDSDVGHFLSVCVELSEFPDLERIAAAHHDVSLSVGVHPNDTEMKVPEIDELVKLAMRDKVVAIGETGLDYYRLEADEGKGDQQESFKRHIRAAIEVNKPLIIHTRQARNDTIEIMRDEKADQCRGVMHCFTEDWDMAEKALELGFYISISGIVTFKNAADLRDIAKRVPMDRLLIETDSPYLAPVPHRGKINEPAYVRYVADYMAELRGVTYDEIAKITTDNFFTLFSGAKPTV